MIIIRKIITFLLLAVLVFSFTAPVFSAEAATMDSYVGAVTTGGGSLYVRSAASTSAPILTALKKGSYVTLIEKAGVWWKVEYASNKYGYCHGSYITPVEGTPAKVNTGGDVLNVRSGPGTSYSRIATVPHGSVVLVRSQQDGWSRVLYNGTQLGYVSNRYLSTGTNSGGSTTPSGYQAVSLNIPSFKQTDSRWANVTLGSSGKTIAKIGCATTAIAMIESYRTGTTIYPDAMSRKLSYTSTGAVYWPSHYKPVTNFSGYLQAVYAQLQAGKPVLIGAKTGSGGQHWVVITSFAGGSLSAGNFTINDPGSNSRTTLQQFLNAYPILYKYFTY